MQRGQNDMIYRGHCHCAAIGYALRTHLPPAAWPIRACQCSFCRAHGARTTSDPDGVLEFHAREPALRMYRFGQRVTDFLLCANCGAYIGATCEISGARFGIANVNVLDPGPAQLRDAAPVSYAGESTAERASRRQQRWTPCAPMRFAAAAHAGDGLR